MSSPPGRGRRPAHASGGRQPASGGHQRTPAGSGQRTSGSGQRPSGSGQRHLSAMFNAESERLPASLPVRLLRWWIPLALCVIGVVLLVADNFDSFGVAAFAAFAGAGSSTWLINWLWRLGVSGDDEREREALDRAFLATRGRWPSPQERAFLVEHGHWPDEQPG